MKIENEIENCYRFGDLNSGDVFSFLQNENIYMKTNQVLMGMFESAIPDINNHRFYVNLRNGQLDCASVSIDSLPVIQYETMLKISPVIKYEAMLKITDMETIK